MKRDNPAGPEFSFDSATSAVAEAVDKRQHARVPVSVGAEVIDVQTRVRIAGRVTDFGVGGCYVDSMNTFAEGTSVDVFLHWQGRTLQLRALVSYAVTGRSIGMGLSFTGTTAEDGGTLLDWVTGLGEPPRKPEPKPAPVRRESRVAQPGWEESFNRLIALLVQKRVLTESEGVELSGKNSGPGGED